MSKLNNEIFRFGQSLFVLVLFVAYGCNSDDFNPKMQEMDEAKALWNAQKIESYTYTIVSRGFHPHDSLDITVDENRVVKVVDLRSDTLLVGRNSSFVTIDDLFMQIAERLNDLPSENVSLSFNDSLGYPETVYYD